MSTAPPTAKQILSKIASGQIWDDVTDLIIRPPRCKYRPNALGPSLFRISAKSSDCFAREDLELENMRGMKLKCSWYRKVDKAAYNIYMQAQRNGMDGADAGASAIAAVADLPASKEAVPCVVYLHGNCGSRLDSRDCLFLLEEGISVFAIDLSGSGRSDGEFVSLGFFERQDLLTVVDYLNMSKRCSAIGLWGRSMGAVTAIMYASRDPTISCIVCDSPFSSLRLLSKDLALMHASWVPGFAVDSVVGKIKASVMERAGFDIDDLDTLSYARKSSVVPAFIFHGEDDDFVRYEHSQAVAEHYAGSCIHHVVKGDHNSTRRSDVRDIARAFMRLYLIDKPAAETERKAAEAAKAARTDDEQAAVAPTDPAPAAASDASSVGDRGDGSVSSGNEADEEEGSSDV